MLKNVKFRINGIPIRHKSQLNKERMRAMIFAQVVEALTRFSESAQMIIKERFQTVLGRSVEDGGSGQLTRELRDAYLKSFTPEVKRNTGRGISIGLFNLSVLEQNIEHDRPDISWWKIHEFGSPSFTTPLSETSTRQGGSDTHGFLPKRGEGRMGEGIMVDITKAKNVEPHPGVIPLRVIGKVRELAEEKLRNDIRVAVRTAIIKGLKT